MLTTQHEKQVWSKSAVSWKSTATKEIWLWSHIDSFPFCPSDLTAYRHDGLYAVHSATDPAVKSCPAPLVSGTNVGSFADQEVDTFGVSIQHRQHQRSSVTITVTPSISKQIHPLYTQHFCKSTLYFFTPLTVRSHQGRRRLREGRRCWWGGGDILRDRSWLRGNKVQG